MGIGVLFKLKTVSLIPSVPIMSTFDSTAIGKRGLSLLLKATLFPKS